MSSQPETRSSFCGVIFLVGFVLLVGSVLIVFVTGAPLSEVLPDLPIGSINRILGLQILTTLMSFILVLLASRLFQWPVIEFLDRMLPKRKRTPSPPKPSRTEKLSNWLVPETEMVNVEQSPSTYGDEIHQTVEGEQFISGPHFPDWWVTTFWDVMVVSIPALALGNLISLSVSLTTGVGNVVTLSPIILATLISIPLRYWGSEWSRLTHMLFITTHNYIKWVADFSWFGFIFGRGFDLDVRTTPMAQVRDVDSASVPRKLIPTMHLSRIYEAWVELWADRRKVGTIVIRSHYREGQEVFLNLTNAPMVRALLNYARQMYDEITGDLATLDREGDKYMVGSPEDDLPPYPERKSRVENWRQERVKELRHAEPHTIDLLERRAQRLGRRPPTPSSPNPTRNVGGTVAHEFEQHEVEPPSPNPTNNTESPLPRLH